MNYHEKVLPILASNRKKLIGGWGIAQIIEQKSDSPIDIVTEIDYEIEAQTSIDLNTIFPDIGFVGEENGGDRNAARFWLMDPIDGTGHYMRGLPFCTTMLCLIEEGEPIFSVIYDFLNDDFYWAEKGNGAYKNKERIKVSNRALKDSYISCETKLEIRDNKIIYEELKNKTQIVQTLSAGWEYIMVASGKLDARICLDPFGKDYDFTPGNFLVSEATGIVKNIGFNSYDYRNVNFISANPIIYDELTKGAGALFPVE